MRTDLTPIPLAPLGHRASLAARYEHAVRALAAAELQRDTERARRVDAEARAETTESERARWEAAYYTLQRQWDNESAALRAAFGVGPYDPHPIARIIGQAPATQTVSDILEEFGTGPCVSRERGEACSHFDCVAEYAMATQLADLRRRLAAVSLVHAPLDALITSTHHVELVRSTADHEQDIDAQQLETDTRTIVLTAAGATAHGALQALVATATLPPESTARPLNPAQAVQLVERVAGPGAWRCVLLHDFPEFWHCTDRHATDAVPSSAYGVDRRTGAVYALDAHVPPETACAALRARLASPSPLSATR